MTDWKLSAVRPFRKRFTRCSSQDSRPKAPLNVRVSALAQAIQDEDVTAPPRPASTLPFTSLSWPVLPKSFVWASAGVGRTRPVFIQIPEQCEAYPATAPLAELCRGPQVLRRLGLTHSAQTLDGLPVSKSAWFGAYVPSIVAGANLIGRFGSSGRPHARGGCSLAHTDASAGPSPHGRRPSRSHFDNFPTHQHVAVRGQVQCSSALRASLQPFTSQARHLPAKTTLMPVIRDADSQGNPHLSLKSGEVSETFDCPLPPTPAHAILPPNTPTIGGTPPWTTD